MLNKLCNYFIQILLFRQSLFFFTDKTSELSTRKLVLMKSAILSFFVLIGLNGFCKYIGHGIDSVAIIEWFVREEFTLYSSQQKFQAMV